MMTQAPETPPFDDDVEDGFGLADLLRVLSRHWRVIAITTATCAALTAQFMLMMPNQYKATATVQVSQGKNQVLDADAVIKQIGGDSASVESEVEVMRSADLALMVIAHLKLRSDPEFSQPGLLASLSAWLGMSRTTTSDASALRPSIAPGADGAMSGTNAPAFVTRRVPNESIRDYLRERTTTLGVPARDTMLQAFRSRFKAGRVRNSLLIEVEFTSSDPVKSARIANAFVDVYLDAQINAKDRAEDVASRLLDQRIGLVRKKLTAAERKLESFKTLHDLFDADGRFILDKQLGREMDQLVVARTKTADARARYNQARAIMADGGDTSALQDVLKSNTVRSLRDQLARSLRQQAQLRTKYGPLHPSLKKANADVRKARSELLEQIQSIIRNLKTELRIAEARERQQAASIVQLKSRIAESKDKTWELEELTRDATTSRKLYEEMLGRAKQLKQSVGLQFPDARIVQRATVPLSPAGPKRKQFVLLALIGGFVFAFGAAFLFEMLRPGFETARETEKELLVEQIAALPAFAEASPPDRLRNARVVVAEPISLYTEAMRSLAHVVVTRRGPRQLVLMMSSLPGEGRSTTASNLAVQLAVSGQRVLLVDADLRQAGLSATLGVADHLGLADVVAGAAPPSAAILRDATTGLSVLPARRRDGPPVSPVELLNSEATFGLFDALRAHFDLIIVDAPALLPVADARVLSDVCDSAVMVVKWRQTARSHVKQALRTLGPNQSKVIGIVMSGVEEGDYIAQMGLRATTRQAAEPARAAGPRRGLAPAGRPKQGVMAHGSL